MIRTFADRSTELLARGQRVQRFVAFERVARRKLQQLEIAGDLQDLRIPPGNHLEKLSGDREGFWSIRINDQYRICFRWTAAGPADVQITDYH
ncbi:MAG: excinuclease ABC subunit A [Adlercreutzia caecimuris]|uniref:type II toxin-antitoxin system RelE/ParE family toxin n=1 Tax=Adlercreutzia caecimuris TaxID=671266 RepID=UPI00242F517F|nr:type II toxin-antitoxin system RelE/ParE family toxin [Adlercreutzia caecimuris]MCI9208165.1 excinuclease ABC subunit A [Adlercreutzia caecimuris]